ncbi:MAG: hypothetical protein HKN45_07600 [Flavobacteriales bacterium]|nr:hypothetical protein [Flavobacteriales bacterium]
MRTFRYFLPLILILAFSLDFQAQCAMCRAVIESDVAANGQRVSEGINHGILYLMGFPYLLMFAVAAFLFRKQIKAAFSKA